MIFNQYFVTQNLPDINYLNKKMVSNSTYKNNKSGIKVTNMY